MQFSGYVVICRILKVILVNYSTGELKQAQYGSCTEKHICFLSYSKNETQMNKFKNQQNCTIQGASSLKMVKKKKRETFDYELFLSF